MFTVTLPKLVNALVDWLLIALGRSLGDIFVSSVDKNTSVQRFKVVVAKIVANPDLALLDKASEAIAKILPRDDGGA